MTRARGRRSGFAASAVVSLAACRDVRHESSLPGATPPSATPPPDARAARPPTARLVTPDGEEAGGHDTVASAWCESSGLAAVADDVCYILPDLPSGKPRRLLVYLHGIVPPGGSTPQKENVVRALRGACARAGAAGLLPRGRQGIGPAGARDFWAWPTTSKSYAELASALVARWTFAKARLHAIVGRDFERTYLAGSSNGAYFVTALAARGDLAAFGFHVDALGAMSGGSMNATTATALRERPLPFYIGFGTFDPATARSARALERTLLAAGWPTRVAEHPYGHGAKEEYIDEAFAFWDDATDPSRRDDSSRRDR